MAGGLTNYAKTRLLDQLFGNGSLTVPGPWYIGLVSDTNTQAQRAAGTFTELSGNGYARVSQTNNATNWPNATTSGDVATKTTGTAVTFPTATGTQGTATAVIITDAASSGNIWAWADLLDTEQVVVCTDASTDLLTCPGHGYSAGDKIKFSSITGIAVPTGLTDGGYYYVIAGGLTTDAFKVSATVGGSAVDLTALGGGKVGKSQELTITNGVTPSLPSGGLTETLR